MSAFLVVVENKNSKFYRGARRENNAHRGCEGMHQPLLSGKAKDTVTRRTVMILVSDHTFTPPHRDPICIQPALPASTSSISSSSWSSSRSGKLRHRSPRPGLHFSSHVTQTIVWALPQVSLLNVSALSWLLRHRRLIYTVICKSVCGVFNSVWSPFRETHVWSFWWEQALEWFHPDFCYQATFHFSKI